MNELWLGYQVKTVAGPVLRPRQIRWWKNSEFGEKNPERPLFYHADALVGLATVRLNQELQNPFISPHMNFSLCFDAWRSLEPHLELHQRSMARLQSLKEGRPSLRQQ